ncbi:MAG: hypothetical protein RLY67_956 [Pseudomonadota bacterium]
MRENSIDTKTILMFGGLLVFFVGGGHLLYEWLVDKDPIDVEIRLVNQCNLPDSVFLARVLPDGPKTNFSGGRGRVRAIPGQRIRLVANDVAFKDFGFEGQEVKAASKVTLTANCDSNASVLEAIKGVGKR